MIVNVHQSTFDNTLPNVNNKFNNKVSKNNHIILKSCLFFLFLLIAGGAFFLHRYFSLIPSLLSVTDQSIIKKANTQTNTEKITYNNGQLINILLLGSDNDEKFSQGSILTQTMIIVSINPNKNTVNIISIPRDSWVKIPGVGMGKIDQASGYGGLSLAIETVEEDYGIKIDHYAWVGLAGFVKVVDTLGGVNIDVLHPVLDEAYPMDMTGNPNLLYASQRLYIPAGPQHLDGTTALEYVRSRHGDLLGDFGRSQRQQQLLLAIRKKMNKDNLITDLPTLAQELNGSVKTDMNVVDLTDLATIGKNITSKDIHQYVLLPPDYGKTTQSADGQDIVAPDWQAINTLFNKLFTQQ